LGYPDGVSRNTRISLVIIAVSAALVAILTLLPAREIAVDLITQIRGAGAAAPVIFFFVFVFASLLGFSRTVLTIAAGIAFDPVVAFTVVMAALMTAFMCSYLLARGLLADWVAARLEKMPTARDLMTAVEDNSFRMLVMMRMNPFVPGFVNGYGFGLTAMRPLTYFLASVVGSIPLTLIYLYLGWASGEAILRSGGESEKMQEGTMLFGVGLSVLMLILIIWYGRRTIVAAGSGHAE